MITAALIGFSATEIEILSDLVSGEISRIYELWYPVDPKETDDKERIISLERLLDKLTP